MRKGYSKPGSCTGAPTSPTWLENAWLAAKHADIAEILLEGRMESSAENEGIARREQCMDVHVYMAYRDHASPSKA